MTIESVYVRCRNGAIYQEPIVVFPEGFICFDVKELPELVLWSIEDKLPDPNEVMIKRLQADGFDPDATTEHKRSERVMPGSDPWIYAAAQSFYIGLLRRIPIPSIYRGQELYFRDKKGVLFDWASTNRDVYQTYVPGAEPEPED